MKYYGMCNEIDLVRHNPDLFVPDYQDATLALGYDLYTRAVNMLNRHARAVANKEIEPKLFEPGAYDPALRELPIFIFKKKAPDADVVEVPDVLGFAIGAAQKSIRDQGLNPTSSSVAVDSNSRLPTDVVTSQNPQAGQPVPKGTNVVITYNFVASRRFPWLVRNLAGLARVRVR
jgi:hypothetical protein